MSHKYVDDIKVPIEEDEIQGTGIMYFAAGTTGPRGGDSGHGCRTVIELDDDGSTDMRIVPTLYPARLSHLIKVSGVFDKNLGEYVVSESNIPGLLRAFQDDYTGVSIQLGGDSELYDLIEGLQFMVDTLKRMARKVCSGQTWRHFKGGIVIIITVANHSESSEPLVIYKCESGTYARPLDMFLSEVDYDRYPDAKQRYRFELVTDQEVDDED